MYFLNFIIFLFFSGSASAQSHPEVSVKLSSPEVWQRQQVLITLEVKTDDPFSRLEVEEFKQAGFNIVPFDQERIENDDFTRLSIKWGIYPFVSGSYKLQLPQIRYRPNHGRIQKLTIEELPLTVKHLPIYVPPTMPVGKIAIESDWSNGKFVNTNNLLEWKIKITGEGVAQQTMPPLSRQLVTTQSLRLLPFKSQRKVQKTARGVIQQIDYTIPLKAMQNGRINFLPLEIQYFEPVTGKLNKTKLSPPFVISLNKWLYVLISSLLTLLLLALVLPLFKILKRASKKSTQRKYARKLLSEASSYQQIRDAIKQLSIAHGWSENTSLAEFTTLWNQKNGASNKLQTTIEKLQELQFSTNKSTKVKNISQDLMKYF